MSPPEYHSRTTQCPQSSHSSWNSAAAAPPSSGSPSISQPTVRSDLSQGRKTPARTAYQDLQRHDAAPQPHHAVQAHAPRACRTSHQPSNREYAPNAPIPAAESHAQNPASPADTDLILYRNQTGYGTRKGRTLKPQNVSANTQSRLQTCAQTYPLRHLSHTNLARYGIIDNLLAIFSQQLDLVIDTCNG